MGSVARTTGYPDFSSQGSSKWSPQIWSGKTLVKFYDNTVLSEISNTDYEGEIKGKGDTVIIRTIADVVVGDYVKDGDIVYGAPESPDVELNIDKAKFWAVKVDDIDKAQSDIAILDKYTGDAANKMKIAIDTQVFANIYTDVDAANTGIAAGVKSGVFNLGTTGSAVAVSKTNILDYIIDMGTVLDEQNAPQDGRWLVIPPWLAGMIKKSDLKDASLTGDGSSILRNGRIGSINNFTLYISNLLSYYTADTAYRCLFGTKEALTFATQIVKTEPIRLQNSFGDAVRGLQVYGYKVVKGQALGMFYAKKAA